MLEKQKYFKQRVRSYFTGVMMRKHNVLSEKLRILKRLSHLRILKRLVLELNLIKQHDPKYNIMLKDDKTYPYLKITAERHPKLIITRQVKKDKGKYFGPYPNSFAASETKKLLDRIYPYRKCHTLPDRACLYYHLGQCLAPCINEVEEETYKEMVDKYYSVS